MVFNNFYIDYKFFVSSNENLKNSPFLEQFIPFSDNFYYIWSLSSNLTFTVSKKSTFPRFP